MENTHPPRVEAHLARSLDPDNIKEGDDAFFECRVNANPSPRAIVWLHEGKEIVEGSGSGSRLFLHGDNLVFQGLMRGAEGNYQCRVTNDLGTALSVPTRISVQYAPECIEKNNNTVSVSPDEEANLKCDVDASPKDMKFRWAVNTTKGLIDVDPVRYTQDGPLSYLSYKPYSYQIIHQNMEDEMSDNKESLGEEEDKMPPPVESFGVVFCWAQNRIGWQREPCTFIVKPAGKINGFSYQKKGFKGPHARV
ncbi:hypothetical protein HAZT_HAZT009250 [Hyalella azteca]|uniref:Ig-like domain-containing protein n=1 Tax=Hyalella azteca TaxID=294128 RepID=A0A6A0GQD6_HYAAZ|nr:hypothetical protein HAZT_HAZT009250 [Hyalella azteca]